jgi:hypothetical protein
VKERKEREARKKRKERSAAREEREEKIFHGKLRSRYRPWSNFRRRKEPVWIVAAPSPWREGASWEFFGKRSRESGTFDWLIRKPLIARSDRGEMRGTIALKLERGARWRWRWQNCLLGREGAIEVKVKERSDQLPHLKFPGNTMKFRSGIIVI